MDMKFKLLMLQAEIAALLHDIGKFTRAFQTAKDYTEAHTQSFFDPEKANCSAELLQMLNAPLPAGCLQTPDGNRQLQTLGDLARWHHEKPEVLKAYFETEEGDDKALPMVLYLMVYADTVDSATSKGGAAFNGARFNGSESKQQADAMYLATPFGHLQATVSFRDEEVSSFQNELAGLLRDFSANCGDLQYLTALRKRLQDCLERHLARVLAETRLPNNDVSLWQHSYSSAALFKGMLARHLLAEEYSYCDNRGYPQYYGQKLAVLGIRWSEDAFIAGSFRPAEILGRRKKLDDCVNALKERVETDYLLGNEIYRNRDGIYFLIPAIGDEKGAVKSYLDELLGGLDPLVNGPKTLAGELSWQARYLEVGLQITRLAEVVDGDAGEVLAFGPRNPAWIRDWKGTRGSEICPRCGLRPVPLQGTVVGSKGDDTDNVCRACQDFSHIGGRFRSQAEGGAHHDQARRLLAVDHSSRYFESDLKCFFTKSAVDERRRLALVQGVFDLRPCFSGQAFSSVLAARPQNFINDPDEKDRSGPMATWDEMLNLCRQSWDDVVKSETPSEAARHSLRQIFRDSYLFTKRDGRADGADEYAKGRHYLRDTVLTAPFAATLGEDEAARLVNYALRQHPSPSRLARVWETTLEFNRRAVACCEAHGITYAPLGLDAGRFMLLLPANRAWEFLQAMGQEHREQFGRLRHLLPLHLSATIFYHKSPLYLAIDAARRFARLGLKCSEAAQYMEIVEKSEVGQEVALRLRDGRGRTLTWRVPEQLPNDQKDHFYGWFWVQGISGHPVHRSDLCAGQRIAVYPSTFDYEILDATTRRYDIRDAADGEMVRPHLFMKAAGPRPYPLSVLEAWAELDAPLKAAETSQRKHLVELLAGLHRSWSGHDGAAYAEDLRHLAEDALKNTLGKKLWNQHGPDRLLDMACDGSLFDLFEWQDFINR